MDTLYLPITIYLFVYLTSYMSIYLSLYIIYLYIYIFFVVVYAYYLPYQFMVYHPTFILPTICRVHKFMIAREEFSLLGGELTPTMKVKKEISTVVFKRITAEKLTQRASFTMIVTKGCTI